DDVIRGFGKRFYNWLTMLEIDQQLTRGVSVQGTYIRRTYGNFSVTDNLAVTPKDFDPYCVNAPVDARRPQGGGYQICGLYDVNPSKFGQVNNLVAPASHYGKQSDVSTFFNVALTAR